MWEARYSLFAHATHNTFHTWEARYSLFAHATHNAMFHTWEARYSLLAHATHNTMLSSYYLPGLTTAFCSMEQSNDPCNITSGFRTTGVFPVNSCPETNQDHLPHPQQCWLRNRQLISCFSTHQHAGKPSFPVKSRSYSNTVLRRVMICPSLVFFKVAPQV